MAVFSPFLLLVRLVVVDAAKGMKTGITLNKRSKVNKAVYAVRAIPSFRLHEATDIKYKTSLVAKQKLTSFKSIFHCFLDHLFSLL